MDKTVSVHLDDDDQIECRHAVSESCPGGYPVLTIRAKDGGVNSLDIYATPDRLQRLYLVVGAYLAAHDAPDDRADVVPAEACCCVCAMVDADDLLAAMASSFEPRRTGWGDDEAIDAAGVRNAPRSNF